MVSRLGAKSSVDKTDDGGLKRDFTRNKFIIISTK